MFCGKLNAWYFTELWLITLLPSLIARLAVWPFRVLLAFFFLFPLDSSHSWTDNRKQILHIRVLDRKYPSLCLSTVISTPTGVQIRTLIIAQKAVSHVINSRALTGERPCINKAIHALLMHGYATFNMIVSGPRIAAVTRCVLSCPRTSIVRGNSVRTT